MMLFDFFKPKPERKKIYLVAVHISGEECNFGMYLDEFNTTIDEQRTELNAFLQSISELLASTEISEREIFAEFGHHKIRVNDYSSFSILDSK